MKFLLLPSICYKCLRAIQQHPSSVKRRGYCLFSETPFGMRHNPCRGGWPLYKGIMPDESGTLSVRLTGMWFWLAPHHRHRRKVFPHPPPGPHSFFNSAARPKPTVTHSTIGGKNERLSCENAIIFIRQREDPTRDWSLGGIILSVVDVPLNLHNRRRSTSGQTQLYEARNKSQKQYCVVGYF